LGEIIELSLLYEKRAAEDEISAAPCIYHKKPVNTILGGLVKIMKNEVTIEESFSAPTRKGVIIPIMVDVWTMRKGIYLIEMLFMYLF